MGKKLRDSKMNTIKLDQKKIKGSKQQTNEVQSETPFLQPIENPSDEGLKMAYESSAKYMGKVIMPLKVLLARMPSTFTKFYLQIGELDSQLALPHELAQLIRLQVARINVCLFCIDSSRFGLLTAQTKPEKIEDLPHYKTSPFYSEAERAALDYASELTTKKQMSKEIFQTLTNHFTEREICDIVYIIASEHIYNMGNIGLNIHSDDLCNTAWKNN